MRRVACAARLGVLLVLTGSAAADSGRPEPPETVEIVTDDGVVLCAAYYEPRGRARAPVAVLVGDQGESRAALHSLAATLQAPAETDDPAADLSWAVLAVDLRGQGDSVKAQPRVGEAKDLSGMEVDRATLAAMVRRDMEAVRRFLVDKNDAGEVNLNQLAYVGVGMGALVATNAAALDWSMPDLNGGKQGRDVKALALVSPPWSLEGLGMLAALRQPGVRRDVAVLVMYGQEDRSARADAKRICKQLTRGRPDMPEPTPAALPPVLDAGWPSKLQGSAWLKEAGADAETLVARFLREHVADQEMPWTRRRLD